MAYRMRYQIWLDWVGPGAGPLSGQMAVDINTAGAAGAQTVGIFNGGPNGSIYASGNSGPQIIGTGTNGALAAADLQALLTAGTLVQNGNNLVADIYSQFVALGGANPIQTRTTQFANPGNFGAG